MTQMMTIPENITLLLTRRWNGESLTGAELAALEQWLAVPFHSEQAEALRRVWKATENYPSHYEPDIDTGWNALHARISEGAKQAPPSRVIPLRRRQWLAVAASLLLLAAAGYMWWPSPQTSLPVHTVGATSGRPLELGLPDGSLIVLQDGSELSYPDPFEESATRWVEISGEAYFKVAPDARKPFQVRTAYATVEVLGTAFNVRALPGEPEVEVTVESGLVQLSSSAAPDNKLQLQAGERGLCNPEGDLRKAPDTEVNAISWLTDKLRFRNTPLPQAIEALCRHYGIAIEMEKESLKACTYTGSFEKTALRDVLQTLELTFGARMISQGEGQYLLKGGSCAK